MKKCLGVILIVMTHFVAFSQVKPKPKAKVQSKPQPVKEINYCDQIRKSTNSDGSIFEMSPSFDGIRLVRNIAKGDTAYYVSVEVTSNIKFDNPKGVELFFAGNTLTFEDKDIEVGANENDGGDMYVYKAFIKLSRYELLMFMIYDLKIVKLYVIDKRLKTETPKALKETGNCFF